MVDLSIVIPIAGAAAIVTAAYLARYVMKQDAGSERIQEVADAIREGARAFMRRQYRTIAIIAAILALVFAGALGVARDLGSGAKTALAFALGSAFSAISGYIGMYISIRANQRCAAAAQSSYNAALKTALRGGAVSGLAIVAMSLLGVSLLYYVYGWGANATRSAQTDVILSMVGFGFGASLVALFAQLGGGIYTKAADVGADLVGKIEKGIPEDDPRNPAVIADLVGDNVGDCAGRGADLFESTAAENIGAMVLGAALFPYFGLAGILFPLVARAFGLIASIVGVFVVSTREEEAPMRALNRGYGVTTIIAALFFGLAAFLLLQPSTNLGIDPLTDPDGPGPLLGNPYPVASSYTWLYYFGCGLVGIVAALLFIYITQYYTEARFRPVKDIAKAAETGPATDVISGFSVGLEATALPALTIMGAILLSFYLGELTGIRVHVTASFTLGGGLFGTAVATMGMLSTAAYILAMDTFGPIADNAAGIVEMAGISGSVRKQMDKLDAAGNTTKALTKGYAVGSAALAAFLLFSAYLEAAGITSVDLAKPEVFVGGIAGVALVFLFSAFAIRSVGRAAWAIIKDVRAQFKENPEIMTGAKKPDYGRSVDIVTRAALREMVVPGLLAVLTPIAVGLAFKYVRVTPGLAAGEPLGATLMVGTIAGVILALVLNTGGGAWDNAKKYVESLPAGKGTEQHKATVVGDTVGDPFKDTAGPSLHILVKLLSTLTLVLAPLLK
ncbi:MAG: sodium-translocating pyrophosphatase [Methanobacteriota archaeon]|nr:MAG: sodium-translocating pyrophosphatase [Euryarchaeota archaeon]